MIFNVYNQSIKQIKSLWTRVLKKEKKNINYGTKMEIDENP